MSLILLLIANCKSEGFELVLSLLISFGGIASNINSENRFSICW